MKLCVTGHGGESSKNENAVYAHTVEQFSLATQQKALEFITQPCPRHSQGPMSLCQIPYSKERR